MYWLDLYDLDTNHNQFREGHLNCKNDSIKLAGYQVLEHFLNKIEVVEGPPIVGGTTSRMMDLDSVRIQAENTILSKPGRSIPPWPLHHLLTLGSCPVWVLVLASFSDGLQCASVDPINSFLPQHALFL